MCAAAGLFAEPLKATPQSASEVTPALIIASNAHAKRSAALSSSPNRTIVAFFLAALNVPALPCTLNVPAQIFQRIAQEQGSGIKAVEVANSTNPAHYLDWKKSDWLGLKCERVPLSKLKLMKDAQAQVRRSARRSRRYAKLFGVRGQEVCFAE
jgi:hypothetical protein